MHAALKLPTMAADAGWGSDFEDLFEDSGDESSFNGFSVHSAEDSDDSDVNLVGLVNEEDQEDGRAATATAEEEDDQDEEDLPWSDQLHRVVVPDFSSAISINFPLPENPREIDFVLAFIDDDLWDLIVLETNRYAQQKLANSPARLANYLPITRPELKAFIAVNIIMGMVKLPSVALYWSSNDFFGNRGVMRIMSKNRFEEISQYLHFSDSSVEPACGTPGFDRLYKVRSVFDCVRQKCQVNFSPSKNISVDEGMIGYGGRLSFRQYMQVKPTKYGIKMWMAADSSNGYVLNFDAYLGQEEDQRTIHGLGYDVVFKMVTPFMNKHHHVFFDNYFSSVKLLRHLEAQNTYACAMVRTNWKELPRCAQQKLRPGQKCVWQKGNIVFTKWHDKRDASFISTNVNPLDADVVIQHGDKQIQKPSVVVLYKSHIGGVDLADQMHKYYTTGHSSYKWYKYLFWFLVDLSICNAFILCNFFRQGQGQGKLKQAAFRTSLAMQLVDGFSSRTTSAKRRKIESLSLSAANASKHFIEKIKGRKRECVNCKKAGRKTAKGCPVESSFKCIQCDVTLCKVGCFQEYHNADG